MDSLNTVIEVPVTTVDVQTSEIKVMAETFANLLGSDAEEFAIELAQVPDGLKSAVMAIAATSADFDA